MIKPGGVWKKSEGDKGVELYLSSSQLTLFMLCHASQGEAESKYASFEADEINHYLKHPKLFEAQIQMGDLDSANTTFRLFGAEAQIPEMNELLIRLGFKPGRHLSLSSLPTLFQFFSKENRIRKQAKIKVLVVDDSDTLRKLLSRIIAEDPLLECVGTVELPSQVESAIEEFKPDVLTLDIHMPEMDGVTLLKRLLPKFGLPTIMISSLSKEEGTYVLDALEAGAVDYLQKPTMKELKWLAPLICEKIKSAAEAKVLRVKSTVSRLTTGGSDIDFSYLIGIGSSTGGTEALKQVLTRFPSEIPPVVIVQHIPPVFSKAFAERMDSLCPFRVKEAEDGDLVEKNTVYIAPGGFQMRVVDQKGVLKITIEDTHPVNRHKPSVDVLFDSMLALKRKNMVAAILTGMGADGARGAVKLKDSGVFTIAQDEASCVVYGMPREAVKLGGICQILPLDHIAESLINAVLKKKRAVA